FVYLYLFFFSSRRRHTSSTRDWSSDVCSSDLIRYFGGTRRCSATLASATVHHPLASRRKSNTACTPSTLYSTTAFAREPSTSKLRMRRCGSVPTSRSGTIRRG